MQDIHVIHNSHNRYYRDPFGAVVCGTKIKLTIDIIITNANHISVQLEIYETRRHHIVDMDFFSEDGERKTFIAHYDAPGYPGLVWYNFLIQIDNNRYYYCNNHDNLGGVGELFNEKSRGYQLTVHSSFKIPDWYKESIIYQIFPDRFFNGDNMIKMSSFKENSLIHANWVDTPYYIKDQKGHVKRWDFFGGNLLGIIKKIPYLKELGITAIYLNPIFDSASNHKYDTGDYKKIDPVFGDIEVFKNLIAEANKNNIAIILDGVFSHTGSDSLYFNKDNHYLELGAYQSRESPYYKWFRFEDYPDKYECWWGVDTLPNVNEMEPSYLEYIVTGNDSVIRHWLKEGVKGWRLDVADELPDEFIKEIKRVMYETDKTSVLIGEVWEDASRKESYGKLREYFWGEELDAVMNYPFRGFFINYIMGIWDTAIIQHRLMSLYENYPKENFYASMNLIGSHDRIRILTLLGDAPSEQHMSDDEIGKYRLTKSQRQLAIKRLKLLSLIQYTFPGVPCIYYGDEAGMEGYSDPYNRGTYPWGKEELELIEWYKKIGQLRSNYDALKRGEWIPFIADGDLYGYYRTHGETKLLCAFNRHVEESRKIIIPDLHDVKLIDLIEDETLEKGNELLLEPLQGKILLYINQGGNAYE